MHRRTVVLATFALPLALTGCGRIRESRLNPLNWFGRARRNRTAATLSPIEAADGRLLIREVTELQVEKSQGGAIIRAAGLPPTQGWWKAELVSETRGRPDEDGVLTYRFLVYQPLGQTRVSTPQSRRLTAAVFLSDIKLEAITRIVVQGETNSLSSNR
ncbi:MAG TPA: hypothetical protein PK450_05975 [Paracoccaceae bacterium]|nr:hypothetical protein [Paracoccaceae bacterium]